MILTASAAAVGGCLFLFTGSWIVELWSRGAVHPSEGLLSGLAAWIVLGSAGAALSMFLNAAHIVGLQVVCSTVMATTNIGLSVLLAHRIGVAGIIWGTVISYSAFIVLPYSVLVPKLLRRQDVAGTINPSL